MVMDAKLEAVALQLSSLFVLWSPDDLRFRLCRRRASGCRPSFPSDVPEADPKERQTSFFLKQIEAMVF